MNLDDYLTSHKIPRQRFAAKIGVSLAALCRYIHGDRIPRPIILARIQSETRGKVTVQDFVTGWQNRRKQ